MFLFNVGEKVTIKISGEQGFVNGRCEYLEDVPQYHVKYKAADGRASSSWFPASDLISAEAETEVQHHPV